MCIYDTKGYILCFLGKKYLESRNLCKIGIKLEYKTTKNCRHASKRKITR